MIVLLVTGENSAVARKLFTETIPLPGISDPYIRNWVNFNKTSYVVPKHIDYSNRVLLITDLVKQSRLLEGQMELKEE